MIKIMLIPPETLPIPAVGGGAIETLITNLIEINETEKKCELVVISKDDAEARKTTYQHTKIFYYNDNIHYGKETVLVNLTYLFQRVCKKILQNRYTIKLFGSLQLLYPKRYIFAKMIAKKCKVDVIINEGNWDEKYWTTFKKLVGKKNLYNHIHCHRSEDTFVREIIPNSISISRFVQNAWAKSKDIPGQNLVLYNGIDVKRFSNQPNPFDRQKNRERFGANDQTILVLFCGRLIREKGVSELLDAFDMLYADYAETIKLLLVGNVDFSTNTTTTYSQNIIDRASKMKNVISLGYIPNDNISEIYSCADIMVIPSIWQEGAGLVAIEGMASGLPLITTVSGGLTEYVNDNVAIQLPINELLAENLKKHIILLATDETKRKEMGEAGRKRATIFSKEKYYYDFINIFMDK